MEWLKELLQKFKVFEGKEELEQQFVNELDEQLTKTTKEHNIGTLKASNLQEDSQKEGAYRMTYEKDKLQKDYEKLQKKYDELQARNQQLENSRKESLLDTEIVKAGGRNPKAIKALLDMGKIMIKEDGTLEGLDLEGLKKSDSYLFDVETQAMEGTGFTKGDTATVDPNKMSYAQWCKFYEDNPNIQIK